jgi:two-component system response regulator
MKNKTILLVEDNPDDIELTLMAFKENSIKNEIVIARDGEQAIELLAPDKGMKVAPALILLDLKLPKVSGLEVLKYVRSQPHIRRIPVVILTSSKEEQDLVQSYDLGCNSYVRKPVDFSEFIKASKTLGLYWLLMNETP